MIHVTQGTDSFIQPIGHLSLYLYIFYSFWTKAPMCSRPSAAPSLPSHDVAHVSALADKLSKAHTDALAQRHYSALGP